MANETDDTNLDDDLDDYEIGFIDCLLYQQGITQPTDEQFAAALETLDRFLEQRDQGGAPN